MPKSSSFTTPSAVTRMFDGFRSRWMTAWPCAYCTASQTARNSSRRPSTVVRASPAVLGERDALDVLHDEPRRPVGERIGVVQLGDGGVLKLGEGALLGGEPLPACRGEPGITENLDGRDVAQVLPAGEVDDAHPPFAQELGDPIRPEIGEGEFGGVDLKEPGSNLRPGRYRGVRTRRHRPQASGSTSRCSAVSPAVAAARKRRPCRRRPLDRLVEEPLNLRPALVRPTLMPWS